jgi:hypothetical protein
MSAAPPRDPTDSLDLLAMAHYAIAALWGLVSLVPASWVFVARELASTPALHPSGQPPLAAPSALVTALAIGLFVASLAGAALTIWGGRCLAMRRRHRVASLAAVVVALFVPIGTVLGLVTWSVLQRPEVRRRFDG